ncbi:hypothetical protein EJB05_00896 [Eragrostis curvula]|uniref:rRNA N-glycosylase n=1 Tax=Eragrostis curvula TaxID=38414 RepID=A0A5J9WLJ3_9POAL|nr:hypothetical protein EJB05_00896 [Eragrostis curvula]
MASRKKGKNVVVESSSGPPPILDQEIPKPIATFDITDPETIAENYKTGVQNIIEAMVSGSDVKFTFYRSDGKVDCRVPVCPMKNLSPSGAYTIELVDGEAQFLLVGTKYQTWFRGIVTKLKDRFEIDGMEPKMMTRSNSLHTTSRYLELTGKTVAELKVGYQSLFKALHILAGHRVDRQDKDYDVAIAVIMVMFFEAPRFPELFQMCLELLTQMRDDFVGEEYQKLINNWFNNSRDFFEANGEVKERRVTVTEQTVEAIKKVRRSISILCRSAWDSWLETIQAGTSRRSLCYKPPRPPFRVATRCGRTSLDTSLPMSRARGVFAVLQRRRGGSASARVLAHAASIAMAFL